MTESRKVTELNQRSLNLTDAELALVDKFSVLLPMSELPEVVVSNHSETKRNEKQDGEIPADAIIPFHSAKTSLSANQEVKTKDPTSDNQGAEAASSQEEVDHVRSNTEDAGQFDEAITVEFPRDELSITRNASADAEENSGQPANSDEAEDAVFDISSIGNCHDRVDSVAENIESKLADLPSGLLALVSPGTEANQDLVFHSLLVSLANRNPNWRFIAVQGVEPSGQDSQFSIGLGHVLSDEHLLEDVVIPTNIENMDYLAYTEFALTSSAFKNRIGRMLEELKKHYDVVFYNAKAASSHETGALADIIDAIYLLVNLSASEQALVVSAVEGLRKKGARLSGCILSDYQREAS